MTTIVLKDEIHFNSSMVQLKALAKNETVKKERNFNSSMVQLKEVRAQIDATGYSISIPLWYN